MLRISKGEIVSANSYGVFNEIYGIRSINKQFIAWELATARNTVGIDLEVNSQPSDRIHLKIGPVETSFSIEDISENPIIIVPPVDDGLVTIELNPPIDGATELDFEFVDEDIPEGENWYYLRVSELGGGLAWSSPIFVNYKPK